MRGVGGAVPHNSWSHHTGTLPSPRCEGGDADNGRPDGRDRAQPELQTMIREDLAFTEKAPISVFSWLKVPTK